MRKIIRLSRIRVRGVPEYVRSGAGHLAQYPDLRLLSNDGYLFSLHRAVLAAFSPNMKRILSNHPGDVQESCVLSVDISQAHLRIIVKFLTTGCLPTESGPDLFKSFITLGIQIYDMKFSKVDQAKVGQDDHEEQIFRKLLEPTRNKKPRLSKAQLDAYLRDYYKDEYCDGDLDTIQDMLKEEGANQHSDDEWGMSMVVSEEEDLDFEPPETVSSDQEEDNEATPAIVNIPTHPKKSERWALQFPKEGERDLRMTYQCQLCLFGCQQEATMIQHKFRHRFSTEENKLFYFCTVCEQGFVREFQMVEHRKTEHKDTVLQCPHCPRTFLHMHRKTYDNHVKDHELTGDGRCAHCGLQCTSLNNIKYHQQIKGKFHSNHCVQCQEPVATWQAHQDHVRDQHGDVWKYVCGICPELFDTKGMAASHKGKSHEFDVTVNGKECDICLRIVSNLPKHKQNRHNNNQRDYICDKCPKSYKDSKGLYRHLLTHGSDHECHVCGKFTPSAAMLKAHIIRKHGDKADRPFKCGQCDAAYAEKNKLEDHMNKHTGNTPHVCSFCDMRFITYASKRHHERKRHMEISKQTNKDKGSRPRDPTSEKAIHAKNKNPVTCEICGHISKTGLLYYYHKLSMHTTDAEKPVRCNQCGKGFTVQARLTEHMNTHTNARPHVCEYCGKGFNSNWTLNGHVKGVHMGEKIRKNNRRNN